MADILARQRMYSIADNATLGAAGQRGARPTEQIPAYGPHVRSSGRPRAGRARFGLGRRHAVPTQQGRELTLGVVLMLLLNVCVEACFTPRFTDLELDL